VRLVWSPTARIARSDAETEARRFGLRTNDEIDDDACHQLEEEPDWIEMAGGSSEEAEPQT
jgi:hypothetical protein